jgi:glycine cleavage system regulatory protein
MRLLGQDRPGIVRQISQALALLDVNVEELSTGCESAAMSGERLFRADALLRLPNGVSPVQLSKAVDSIAADLMIDVDLVEEPRGRDSGAGS